MSHVLQFSSDTFTLHVDDISNKNSQIIAEHQILDATYTTMQYMGSKSLVKTIQFMYEDSSDTLAAMVSYVNGGYLSKYTDDTGASGSYVVGEFSYKRVQALNQSNPWYRCSMTLTNTPFSGSLYYQWTLPAPPR